MMYLLHDGDMVGLMFEYDLFNSRFLWEFNSFHNLGLRRRKISWHFGMVIPCSIVWCPFESAGPAFTLSCAETEHRGIL